MSEQIDPDAIHDEAAAWFAEHWNPALPLGTWWRHLADAGWAFPSWPEGYGGRGLPSAAAREVARARHEAGAYGSPNGISTFLVAPTLMHYGTPDQLQRYLPGIVDGTTVWCQLFSEPGSGSDMAGLSTRAVRDGDEWVVNGQKVWSSGAQRARYGILIARTDPDAPKHAGITYFLLDMHQPGVEVRPLREMTGDAAFNEVFFTDARVADADRLGEVGQGWAVAMTTLSHERDPGNPGMGDSAAFVDLDLTVPVGEVARAQADSVDGFSLALSGGVTGLLDELVGASGRADDPVTRQRLMRILELRRTSRWSGQRSAAAAKAGGQPGPEVSTLKLVGSEMGRRIRDTGLELMGPDGMLWGADAPTRGLFHSYAMFTPAQSIAGGTDEVQHNIIGERVLGLPREPGESEQRQRPWSALPRS
ncbi:MAG: acyl-CoA dehydrogenase family protein [Acidimicrobiales bacterium]